MSTATPTRPTAPPGPARPRPARPNRAVRVGRWQIYVPLALYLLFTLVPFYWMVVFAVRPRGSTSLLPWPVSTENFETVWNGLGFGVFFANSLKVGLASLVVTTVVALAGGYALARYRFRGRTLFLVAMLCTQFIPGAMMLIPLFEVFRTLDLVNSLWSLVVAETVFQLPLSLILLSGFIRNVPVELEEAAWVGSWSWCCRCCGPAWSRSARSRSSTAGTTSCSR
jgi:multiple sugar transport system permease protein